MTSGNVPAPSRFDPEARRKFDAVRKAIDDHGDELRAIPGVVGVRPGYKFQDGWITDEPAVVVTVEPGSGLDRTRGAAGIPDDYGGVPVDVAPALPAEQLRAQGATRGLRAAGVPIPGDDLALPDWECEAGPETRGPADEGETRGVTQEYEPPPGLSLDEVDDAMTLSCHCSPDAGWPTLKGFLAETGHRLTVAMYDFTAPHIAKALADDMGQADGPLRLNLDPGMSLADGGGDPQDNPKANDIPEDQVRDDLAAALGDRFEFTWAAVKRAGKTTGGIFPSAYHIKVTVRDGQAFWLSSGNWQSSNQPDIDPLRNDDDQGGAFRIYNREWHILVDHPGLASLFEKFIAFDMDQARPLQAEEGERGLVEMPDLLIPVEEEEVVPRAALRFFEPKVFRFTAGKTLHLQPVLTPDNYAERILEHIESAREKLYFQDQYIHVGRANAPGFAQLVGALRAKIDAGLDVRIILRDIGDTRGMLESLQAQGFDMRRVKLQKGCHNKGIIVDSRAVAVGSHNWSSDGTTRNRDATLIIHDPDVAAYYEQVFLYD